MKSFFFPSSMEDIDTPFVAEHCTETICTLSSCECLCQLLCVHCTKKLLWWVLRASLIYGWRDIKLGFVMMPVACIVTKGHTDVQPVAMLVIWWHGGIQVWAVAKVHVWVHGPTAASVWVYVQSFCYHKGPCGYLGSGQPLETMSVS